MIVPVESIDLVGDFTSGSTTCEVTLSLAPGEAVTMLLSFTTDSVKMCGAEETVIRRTVDADVAGLQIVAAPLVSGDEQACAGVEATLNSAQGRRSIESLVETQLLSALDQWDALPTVGAKCSSCVETCGLGCEPPG
jgi:hypothetical protein